VRFKEVLGCRRFAGTARMHILTGMQKHAVFVDVLGNRWKFHRRYKKRWQGGRRKSRETQKGTPNPVAGENKKKA